MVPATNDVCQITRRSKVMPTTAVTASIFNASKFDTFTYVSIYQCVPRFIDENPLHLMWHSSLISCLNGSCLMSHVCRLGAG